MDHPKIKTDADGTLLLNFGEYGEEVEVAAISGDGSRALTVREVDLARVWNVESGELLAEIRVKSPMSGSKGTAPIGREFRTFIEAADLNHDGAYALLGLNDCTAVIYHVDDLRCTAVLYDPKQPPGSAWGVIRAVCYSKDDLALVGFPRRCMGLWSTDGSERIALLGAPSDKLTGPPVVRDTLVSSVEVSSDGRYVFAGAVDMTARIIDVQDGEVVLESRDFAEEIIAILDSAAGVGWATSAGSVWLLNEEGVVEKRLETGEVWEEVAFDTHSTDLLARGLDGSITRWDMGGNRTVLSELPEGATPVRADNARLLCLDGRHYHFPTDAYRIRYGDGRIQQSIERKVWNNRAKLSSDKTLIGVDGWENAVTIWDFRTGERLRSFDCEGGSGCFAFSPDGSLLATGEIGHGGGLYPRHVYVYETATGRCLHKLSEHEWQIKAIEFSPDGSLLASLGDELIVWDLQNVGHPILRVDLSRSRGSFTFIGSEILAIDDDLARVFTRSGERLAFQVPAGYGIPWIISQDGERLCVATKQVISRYRLDTGELMDRLAADIPRPERLPPISMAQQHDIHAGAMLWRTEFGDFIHQSDGPRGWLEKLKLSDHQIAIPCKAGAAVLRVTPTGTEFRKIIPFEGRLRAGHIVDEVSIMVNERGQMFRTKL